MSHAAAKRALGLARSLRELPETTAALVDGSVPHEHARVLASAYTPARASELRELEPKLVDVARRFETRDLKLAVRRLTDAIDGDGGAAAANADWERRGVFLEPSSFGLSGLRGELYADAAQTISAAIEARMADDQDAPGKRRSRAQRRHDAMRDVAQAQFYLSHRDEPAPSRRAGVTLERLTCDCSIHRVLTDGPSLVIDVGRASRVASTGLWRALVARDKGCTEPGCNAPPGWCQVHHDQHWTKGGGTNLANCRLRCRRHHRDDHEGAARSP